jgi:peptide deformylase
MAVLDVLIYGHPILRKKAKSAEFPNESFFALARNMIETMQLHEGVGLAAPQIGMDLRMIVIDPGRLKEDIMSHPLVLINPSILASEGETVYREGCLSIPGIYADVSRPRTVTVQYQDINGQLQMSHFTDVEARIVQHEIDHLNGVLFIDHLNPVRRWLLSSKLKVLKKGPGAGPSGTDDISIKA